MIRGVAYSRRPAVFGGAGIFLAVLAGYLGMRGRAALRDGRVTAAAAERALTDQVAAAAPFDREHLMALRRQVREIREQLGDGDAWVKVREALRSDWRPEGETAVEREGFTVRTGAFRMSAPVTGDWPAIVSTVTALERIPGVGIGVLELAAGGAPVPRSMDLVRVTVVVHTRNNPPSPLPHENP